MPATPLPPPTSEGPLLAWLVEALRPMSRTRVKELLRDGRVAVNGAPTTRHNHPLRPGDLVTINRGRPAGHELERAGITIVFEDDSLLVIDKPAGLLTVATEAEKTDTAFARLSAHLAARRAGRPYIVHRIDRETSGLLLFARSAVVRDRLQANWDGVTKTYLAVVEGLPRPAEGIVENHLVEGRNLRVRAGSGPEAKRAVSRYRVTASRGPYSLVEVELETGRKHQIRVHLAGLGCPVIGDTAYGAKTNPAGRLGLHAWRLAFDHPATGERVELESPLPAKLRRVVS
ncbi:MAG TPA: RluA family pseudouridine synthase [Gemmataceae bacterium]|nr:RluA family pseudouridine synthase [Gemmataceae bacterium]